MTKILICEDHPAMAEVAENILRNLGYDTQVLMDCKEIVRNVKSIQPDLILMDLRMPGVNGDTATELLKKDPETNALPVIIFSADVQYKEKAKKCGADDFIEKPFDINVLDDKIKSLTKT